MELNSIISDFIGQRHALYLTFQTSADNLKRIAVECPTEQHFLAARKRAKRIRTVYMMRRNFIGGLTKVSAIMSYSYFMSHDDFSNYLVENEAK